MKLLDTLPSIQIKIFHLGGGGGGLAFFIRDDIPHAAIAPKKYSHLSVESSGVTIFGRGQDLDIFNIYIHPGANQTSITVRDFSKIVENHNQNTIIVGDFNSKNILWGSPYTCSKGNVIAEFMELNKLISVTG